MQPCNGLARRESFGKRQICPDLKELPHKPVGEGHAPGSISFVPPVSGMMMAGYVVRALLKENGIG